MQNYVYKQLVSPLAMFKIQNDEFDFSLCHNGIFI